METSAGSGSATGCSRLGVSFCKTIRSDHFDRVLYWHSHHAGIPLSDTRYGPADNIGGNKRSRPVMDQHVIAPVRRLKPFIHRMVAFPSAFHDRTDLFGYDIFQQSLFCSNRSLLPPTTTTMSVTALSANACSA